MTLPLLEVLPTFLEGPDMLETTFEFATLNWPLSML